MAVSLTAETLSALRSRHPEERGREPAPPRQRGSCSGFAFWNNGTAQMSFSALDGAARSADVEVAALARFAGLADASEAPSLRAPAGSAGTATLAGRSAADAGAPANKAASRTSDKVVFMAEDGCDIDPGWSQRRARPASDSA